MPETTRFAMWRHRRGSRYRVAGIDLYTGNPYMLNGDAAASVEWDDAKAEANQTKHGISFRSATQLFLDQDTIDLDATRHADGELRRKIIGMIEGRLFAVVYTQRDDVYRLISARRTNSKEEQAWLDSH